MSNYPAHISTQTSEMSLAKAEAAVFLEGAIFDGLLHGCCPFELYMFFHIKMQELGFDPEESPAFIALKVAVMSEMHGRVLH